MRAQRQRFDLGSPVSVVEELSEQLDGRLGAVYLAHRHVQIVHEDDAPLADWRREQATLPLVQTRHDQILSTDTEVQGRLSLRGGRQAKHKAKNNTPKDIIRSRVCVTLLYIPTCSTAKFRASHLEYTSTTPRPLRYGLLCGLVSTVSTVRSTVSTVRSGASTVLCLKFRLLSVGRPHLRLIGRGLRRERHEERHERLRVKVAHQLVLDVGALPGAGGSDHQQRPTVADAQVHQVGIAGGRVDRTRRQRAVTVKTDTLDHTVNTH